MALIHSIKAPPTDESSPKHETSSADTLSAIREGNGQDFRKKKPNPASETVKTRSRRRRSAAYGEVDLKMVHTKLSDASIMMETRAKARSADPLKVSEYIMPLPLRESSPKLAATH
jgi:hypothetical protein